jgi:hypothetical protein
MRALQWFADGLDDESASRPQQAASSEGGSAREENQS